MDTHSNLNSQKSEPKKISVWAEGSKFQAKEIIIPTLSPESSEDIPTIPDLDEFQDILEKELSKPPIINVKDEETANALSEVSQGIIGTTGGIDAVLEKLKLFIPKVEVDSTDDVWTIDSLLAKLSDENWET